MAPRSPVPRSPGDIAGRLSPQAGGPPRPRMACPGRVLSLHLMLRAGKPTRTVSFSTSLHGLLAGLAFNHPTQSSTSLLCPPCRQYRGSSLFQAQGRHESLLTCNFLPAASPPTCSSRSSLKLFYQRPARPRKTELESMLYSANSHLSLSP